MSSKSADIPSSDDSAIQVIFEFIENNWNEIPLIILLSLSNMPMYYKYIEKKKIIPITKKIYSLKSFISHLT